MNIAKYIVLFSFVILLIGILFGKATPLIHDSEQVLTFGFIVFIFSSIAYGILSLVNKTNRIEAGMIAFSLPVIIGLLFTMLRWPFGAVLIVTGSGTFVMLSVGVCIYTLVQKRNGALGIFYLAIGFGTLFFCFRFMRWPGADILFFPFFIALNAAAIYFILQKSKFTLSIGVSLVVIALYCMVFFCSTSQLYRIKYLDVLAPSHNFHENYHIYAWLLYKEGRIEEARRNLDLAKQEATNPYNAFARFSDEDPLAVERYNKAIESLNANQWDDWERNPYHPQ